MDIALIVGVILGLAAMIGSIAYALFVEGSAGGFGNFLSAPSFGIVFGGGGNDCINICCIPYAARCCAR